MDFKKVNKTNGTIKTDENINNLSQADQLGKVERKLKEADKKKNIVEDGSDKNLNKELLDGKKAELDGLIRGDKRNFGITADDAGYIAQGLRHDEWTFENLADKRLEDEQYILQHNVPKTIWKSKKNRWKKRQTKRVNAAQAEKLRHDQLKNRVKAADEKFISNDLVGIRIDADRMDAKKLLKQVKLEGINLPEDPEELTPELKDILKKQYINNAISNDFMLQTGFNISDSINADGKYTTSVFSNYQVMDQKKGDSAVVITRTQKRVFLPEVEGLYHELLEAMGGKVKLVWDKENADEAVIKDAESLGKKVLSLKDFLPKVKKAFGWDKGDADSIPAEMRYLDSFEGDLLDIGADNKTKFEPEKHLQEAFVVLMGAVSDGFYSLLNEFGGKKAITETHGNRNLVFHKDKERDVYNYDLLDKAEMQRLMELRDSSMASARAIIENRMKIFDVASPEMKEQLNNARNQKILQHMEAPVAADEDLIKEEEKERKGFLDEDVVKKEMEEKKLSPEELAAKEEEERLKEWEDVIKNSYRGAIEGDNDGLKQTEWVIANYLPQLMTIMKASPDCKALRGEQLKRYLTAVNDNVYHNLKQLDDEVFKSEVGARCLYVPKIMNMLKDFIKQNMFAALMVSNVDFKKTLSSQSVKEFCTTTPFLMIRNRQFAIMKVINNALGVENFYRDPKQLEKLWAVDSMQEFLCRDTDKVLISVHELSLEQRQTVGTQDAKFKNDIEKFEKSVTVNMNVLDDKIAQTGLCTAARYSLRKNLCLKLGGEYLLGYSNVNEAYVDYAVDNLMAYDGEAQTIERKWTRLFNRSGLPSKLRAKVEAKALNEIKPAFFCKTASDTASKEEKEFLKEKEETLKKFLRHVNKVYKDEIKSFFKDETDRNLKLTRDQWDRLEDTFEDIWLSEFYNVYARTEYNSDAVERDRKSVKNKLNEEIQKISKEKTDPAETKLSRNDYEEGLKDNKVVELRPHLVDKDINDYLLNYGPFEKILKNSMDRQALISVINEQLNTKDSPLHKKYSYLENVGSIEELSKLGFVAYNQFFKDIRYNLTGLVSGQATRKNRLVLDKWTKTTWGGSNFGAIREKLLAEMLCGNVTSENFDERLQALKQEVINQNEVKRLRLDVMMGKELPKNNYFQYSYLDIKGKSKLIGTIDLPQPERIRRCNHAQKLWELLAEKDKETGGKYDLVGRMMDLIQDHLSVLTSDEISVYTGRTRTNSDSKDFKAKKRKYKPSEYRDRIETLAERLTLKRDKKTNEFTTNSDFDMLWSNTLIRGGDHFTREGMDFIKIFNELLEKVEINELTSKGSKKLSFKDYAVEFIMCGMQNDLIGDGKKGEEAFLAFEDQKYVEGIVDTSKQYLRNKKLLEGVLDSIGVTEKEYPLKRADILAHLSPMLAGLKDIDPGNPDDPAARENLEHYGVESVNDLSEYIIDRYSVTDSRLSVEKQQQLEEEKAVFEHKSALNNAIYLSRTKYLDAFDGGKYRLIRDELLSDPKEWEVIMTSSDEEFYAYVDKLEETIGKALNVFNSDKYRGSYALNRQYILRNFKELKNHPDWTEADWDKEIDGFYKTFMESAIAGRKSIKAMLDKVEKETSNRNWMFLHLKRNRGSSTMIMALSYIMQADPSAFSVLYRERDIHAVLENFGERVNANATYMEETLKKALEEPGTGKDAEILTRVAKIWQAGTNKISKVKKDGDQKKIDGLENKREITEQEQLLADYGLFEQFIHPFAATTDPEQFKKLFLEKCRALLEKTEEIKMPGVDRHYLERREKVQIEVQSKKCEGERLEAELFRKQNEYREKRQRLGSPILVAYGRRKAYDKGNVDDARKIVRKIIENEEKTPSFIVELLTERWLSLSGTKKESRVDIIKTEREHLIKLDKMLREKKGPDDKPLLVERDVRKALVYAYAQNAIRTGRKYNGADDGDVDAIINEFKDRQRLLQIEEPKTGLARLAYEEFREDMNLAFYTMSAADFEQIVKDRKNYFKMLDTLCTVIDTTEYNLKVKTGLLDYFRADMINAVKDGKTAEAFTEELNTKIAELIGDKVKDQGDIPAKDLKELNLRYLEDSTNALGHITDKTVTAKERLGSTMTYNREDLEHIIESSGNEEIITYYNRLNVDEQKLFAIALSLPDTGLSVGESLASSLILRDADKERAKTMQMQDYISAFLYEKNFAPRIDYNLAIRRLQKVDAKTGLLRVSKTMFMNALKYTRFCMQKRDQLRPKDWDRMSDGGFTAIEGLKLSAKAKEANELEEILEKTNLNGSNMFREFFKTVMTKDKSKSGLKMYNKMAKLNDTQMSMLILILQDRTALDYTTSDGWMDKLGKKGVSYVNLEKREQLIDELTRSNGMGPDTIRDMTTTITSEHYRKAAETLFSYQLRDDINLCGKNIGRDDFKSGALDRATLVDYEVLTEALNLMDQIEDQNRKITMCREAVKHIDKSGNKDAAEEFKKLEEFKKAKGVTDLNYFEDFLVKEAKKNGDTAMPLLSSYSGLSDNEKLLLFHALKNRDILDVSTDSTFSTAIGLGNMDYVNSKGRDELAEYYIDHLSVAGATNKLTTWDSDIYDAIRTLLSTQVDDTKDIQDANKVKDVLLTGKRSTAVDWQLFARALQFVKRTEAERQIFLSNKEIYRSQGNLKDYGRFRYNYQYMRKNLYSSGNRLSRFLGRRITEEITDAIPYFGVGQTILMTVLSPRNRNKMIEMGIVQNEEAKQQDTEAKIFGYVGNYLSKGVTNLGIFTSNDAVKKGFTITGGVIEMYGKAMQGIWNIGSEFGNLSDIKNANEKSKKYEERDKKREERAKKIQTASQQKVSKEGIERNKHILTDVANGVAQQAKEEDIIDTVSDFIETIGGTAFGEDFIKKHLFGQVTNVIKEALKVTEFIMRLFSDRAMLAHYYDDNGPLADEAKKLKGANLDAIILAQEKRNSKKKSPVAKESRLEQKDYEGLKNMSTVDIMEKAYGFSDFSEHAAYVGWNIVQTLLFSASQFNPTLQTKFQSCVILSALGFRDLIGKQDNDSAEKIFSKLMGENLR